LNAALPALICAEAVATLKDGQQIEIDLEAGEIRSEEGIYSFAPIPEAVMGIFEAGGLVPYTRQRLDAIRKGK
jgi:3-isopropylmalate/(R)-2-methylmalate dehydratase small subunit